MKNVILNWLDVVTSTCLDKQKTTVLPSCSELYSSSAWEGDHVWKNTTPAPANDASFILQCSQSWSKTLKHNLKWNSRLKLFYLLSPLHSYQTLSLLIFSWSLRLLQVDGTVCRKTTGNFRTLHHSHLVSSEVFRLISRTSLSDSRRK